MADRLSLEELLQDELIQPSLRYPSTEALATVAARISGLDLARLLIYDIPNVEPTALPFLVNQFDMSIAEKWIDNISDEMRRNLVQRAIEYHREKGTFSGIKKYVALTSAALQRASTANDRFFAGEDLSAADRALWKQALPEIRIYDFAEESTVIASAVPGPAFNYEDSFLGATDGKTFFCGGWEERPRMGRKAVLIQDEVITDLIWGGLMTDRDYEQLRIPGDGEGAFFTDSPRFQEFLGDPDPSDRVLTYKVSPEDTYGGYQHNLLAPGLQPIKIVPERTYVGTVDGLGLYADEYFDLYWAMESTVKYRVYDSIRLFDKKVRTRVPPSTAYLDSVRFPVDSYTAELLVAIPGVKDAWAFEYVGDFLVEDKTRILNNALEAIQESQSFRDTLFVTTKAHRQVRFGDRKKFGKFRFGDWTEI